MPRFSADATTPSHVLREGSQPIGPVVVNLDSGLIWTAIYCFSSKRTYDVFSASSPLALTPYPLVKGYLQNQVNGSREGLQLLAIDASGPLAPTLHAATMECVLDAMKNKIKHVNAEYLFVFDQEVSAYRMASMASEAFVPVEANGPYPLI